MKNNLDFQPQWGLRGPNRQTIFAALWPSCIHPPTPRRHIVTLHDGEQALVFENGPADPTLPAVALVHGLGGTYASPYMQRISTKLARLGIRVFRVNLRGCGTGVPLARKTAHAGCSRDLADILSWIQQQTKQPQIAVAAFSLGGNILLKMLTEIQQFPSLNISRAVAVAPPIDLAVSCREISIRHRGFYDRSFLRGLRKDLKKRALYYPDCPWNTLKPFPRTLREFDDRFTAPLNGFKGADDYYQKCSSKECLHQIRTPTTILIAKDDPVVPADCFNDVSLSNTTTLMHTTHGGHLGYLSRRLPDGSYRWMDAKVIEWLRSF